jgi:hypothetical protein
MINDRRSKKFSLSEIECDVSEYNDYMTYLSSFRLGKSPSAQKRVSLNGTKAGCAAGAARINLIFGIMCQSDYALIELLLAPLLTHNFYHNSNTNPFAIQFEAFLPGDSDERRIVILI